MNFKETVATQPFILTEGAIVERLRRMPDITLHPQLAHALLIYEPQGRAAMDKFFREYLDVGQVHNLPIILSTPTWRANSARLKQAGFTSETDVNGDCVRFVAAIRADYGAYAKRVFIGGLMGCRGDAYKPEEALSTAAATEFHRFQAKALTKAGVDFLTAVTLPALSEALGLAIALAECGLPYLLSFVLNRAGTLLDGTPLPDAISHIDATVRPKPFKYMLNCVHPSIVIEGLGHQQDKIRLIRERVIGLQGNTSTKSPNELDNLAYLDIEEPDKFAEAMLILHHKFGAKVLGGCCGTDSRHIQSLAQQFRPVYPEP